VIGYGGEPLWKFICDFESGKGHIYKIGTWDTTSDVASVGRLSFTDSPGSDYPLNSNSYFLLPPVIIGNDTTLTFDDIAILPPPAYAQIDISIDRRRTFQHLIKYDWNCYPPWSDGRADAEDWRKEKIGLSRWLGDTVTFRFQLQVISAATADGWYLDNITIGERDTVEQVFSLTVDMQRGWNLISIPIDCAEKRTSAIFPGSTLFTYRNGYALSESLKTGYGYWIKSDTSSEKIFTGEPVECETINVEAGWNLIGSLSEAIEVSGITAGEPDIIGSEIYAYDGSYHKAEALLPGRGYWVKIIRPGILILKNKHNVSTF
jgi:hypothetical protein